MTRKLTKEQADRLRLAAKSIRENPSHYNQRRWRGGSISSPLGDCGTTACVAGWIVHNEGWTHHPGHELWEVFPPNGRVGRDIEAVASRLVGHVNLAQPNTSAPPLFSANWLPKGLRWNYGQKQLANRVADALERLADGSPLEDVSLNWDRVAKVQERRRAAGLER